MSKKTKTLVGKSRNKSTVLWVFTMCYVGYRTMHVINLFSSENISWYWAVATGDFENVPLFNCFRKGCMPFQ